MNRYSVWIVSTSERILTSRKQRKADEKALKGQKKTLKGELLSWLDAIVFAVVVVLLLNQFLFQLFMIPTPSMVDTFLIKDRVYVSKISYGVELYPTGPKVFSSNIPLRDDAIVFYNPMYESRGPLYDIVSQMIYMATFSLVNIDRDEQGNPRERLYVKRAAGIGGDIVRISEGTAETRGFGQSTALPDETFRKVNNLNSAPKQTIEKDAYQGFEAYGELLAYQEANIESPPSYLLQAYKAVQTYSGLIDYYEIDRATKRAHAQLAPHSLSRRSDLAQKDRGLYVPEGYTLPLGDNRDNSQDGRYFGPVSNDSIIGRVKFIFWPFTRISAIS